MSFLAGKRGADDGAAMRAGTGSSSSRSNPTSKARDTSRFLKVFLISASMISI